MSKRVIKHVHDAQEHDDLLYRGEHGLDSPYMPHTMTKRYCFYFDSDSDTTVFLSERDSTLLRFHLSRSSIATSDLSPLRKRRRRCSSEVVVVGVGVGDATFGTPTLICKRVVARPPHRVHVFYLPKHYPKRGQAAGEMVEADIIRPIHVLQLMQQLRGEVPDSGGDNSSSSSNNGGQRMCGLLGIVH